MCSGAACNLCGAGCWNNAAPFCDHATDERHQEPPTAHVVDIEVRSAVRIVSAMRTEHVRDEYRWRCSCGQIGIWKPKAINARRGGVQHVAKMEK